MFVCWNQVIVTDPPEGIGFKRILCFEPAVRAKPPASYPLTMFRKLLRDNGPVWIVTGDGITSHARLLVGIYSIDDAEKLETYKGTTMEFIDPASGNYVYEPALKFFAVFERETAFIVDNRYDALDLRWQVISY